MKEGCDEIFILIYQ